MMSRTTSITAVALLLIMPSLLFFNGDITEERSVDPRGESFPFQIEVGKTIPVTSEQPLNSSFYFPVPMGSTVTSASLSVSVQPFTENGTDYPRNVKINVAGGPRDYEFNNQEIAYQGSWGRNYQTHDGRTFSDYFHSTLTAMKLRFALPINATVTRANINITAFQRNREFIDTNISVGSSGDHFGEVIRVLGDTNGDGRDEALVSAPYSNIGAGRVYHVTHPLTTNPVLFASATRTDAHFGTAISGAFLFPSTSVYGVAVGAPGDNLGNEGTVRVYDYSPGLTSTTESFKLIGNSTGDLFGSSVEGVDIDDDSDIELLVGAPGALQGRGQVYVFEISHSSATLVTVINGSTGEHHFGRDMAVGDMNTDGKNDIAIASDETIRIYNASSSWNVDDFEVFQPNTDSGESTFGPIEFLGRTGTQRETLAVGVPTSSAGSVLMYDGGSSHDDRPDLILSPSSSVPLFGSSIASGDMDHDGINEIVVGSPGTDTLDGEVAVFKRGQTGAWKHFHPDLPSGTRFGFSVGIGDLRRDQWGDLLVGSPEFYGITVSGPGRLFHLEYYDISILPDNRPSLSVGGNTAWTYGENRLTGTVTSGDISAEINDYLRTNTEDYSSVYEGFAFVDILFSSQADSAVENSDYFNLTGFDIRYEETITFEDLSDQFNNVLNSENKKIINMDGKDYVKVPLIFSARTSGRIRIESFDIAADEVPYIEMMPDEIHFPEDSHQEEVLDLYTVFGDDVTPDHYLNISVSAVGNNASYVNVYVKGHRYLAVDLLNGSDKNGDGERDNANWTGMVNLKFTVVDEAGGTFISPAIPLYVDEVNDAPAVSQLPATTVVQDDVFVYSPIAVDDEMDDIFYRLDYNETPKNMTIDPALGTVSWTPGPWEVGHHEWTLVLSDGKDERRYNFELNVIDVPDAPIFLSPPPEAPQGVLVGSTFEYDFIAVDPDINDTLTYIIVFPVEGAGIDIHTGHFSWTPPQYLPEPVRFLIRALDQTEKSTDLEFYLNTTFEDSPPVIRTEPVTTLYDSQKWTFYMDIFDPDEHRFEVELFEGPDGMIYDDIQQKLIWTPNVTQVGKFNISIKVTSTRFHLFFNYTLEVKRSERTWVFTIEGLKDGDTLKGRVHIGGQMILEPSTVQRVEVQVGDSEWMTAKFSEDRWSYDLDTTAFDDGEYVLRARAFDGAVYSDVSSVMIKIKNEKEKRSPLVWIAAVLIVLAIVALIGLILFLLSKRKEKIEQEEIERQRLEALESSKKSIDEFIQEAASDISSDIDYSTIEIDEGEMESKDLEKIDEIFQPLNIPKERRDEEMDSFIPEDPLQKASIQESVIDHPEEPETNSDIPGVIDHEEEGMAPSP